MYQFSYNISKIYSVSKSWVQAFNFKSQSLLQDIEARLDVLLVDRLVDSPSSTEEESLCDLLKKKWDLLALEESKWHLKSRETWLKEGDNNSKLFHRSAHFQNNLNSIVEIKDKDGVVVSSHEEIAEAEKSYFYNHFKELAGCPIIEIINVIDLFPK
jgi:hypothetical protein